MRLLLDSSLSPNTLKELRSAGHDVVWVGDWAEDPGDEAILVTAVKDKRVVVTLDKDFGELAILHGQSHCGIMRIVNFRATQQAAVCLHILTSHAEDLNSGAIITAEPGRIRIRPHG